MVAAVIVLSLIPQAPDFGASDKLGHFTAYAVLMFWFGMLRSGFRSEAHLALALLALGVAIEFAQGLTGYRSFDVADMAANAVGVLIGWALLLTPAGKLLQCVERVR
jgi:VanZ family protein